MGMLEKIDGAVGAHAQWKSRLTLAIEAGSSEFKPEVVKTDNACEFGRWLHGDVDAATKATEKYLAVKKLHADFHAEAGRILELAVGGKREEAMTAMGLGSKYMSTSVRLNAAMASWKDSIK